MRKQITIPETLNDIVKRLSLYAKISESAVISFAVHLLSERFASFEALDEVHNLVKQIQHFYKYYYIKKLPRGKKCKNLLEK